MAVSYFGAENDVFSSSQTLVVFYFPQTTILHYFFIGNDCLVFHQKQRLFLNSTQKANAFVCPQKTAVRYNFPDKYCFLYIVKKELLLFLSSQRQLVCIFLHLVQ